MKVALVKSPEIEPLKKLRQQCFASSSNFLYWRSTINNTNSVDDYDKRKVKEEEGASSPRGEGTGCVWVGAPGGRQLADVGTQIIHLTSLWIWIERTRFPVPLIRVDLLKGSPFFLSSIQLFNREYLFPEPPIPVVNFKYMDWKQSLMSSWFNTQHIRKFCSEKRRRKTFFCTIYHKSIRALVIYVNNSFIRLISNYMS